MERRRAAHHAGARTPLYPDPTKKDFVDLPVLDRCPYFREVMAAFPCPLKMVRLLKLAAGAQILEHSDYNLGYEDGEVRFHIPIQTNPEVEFVVGGRTIPLREGESWYIYFNLPHRIHNRGTTDRIHLVIDCVVDPWVEAMFTKVTRRAALPEDDAFLYELFKAVRMPEFAHVTMAPAQLEMLMRIQHNGQTHSYASQYPRGHDIVLLTGRPIGRIWVHRGAEEHSLVDISLLPAYRNRGIGAGLVTEAIAAAREAGVRLCCSVAVTNQGSLRFHQRLGFEIVGQDEVYYDLALPAPGQTP